MRLRSRRITLICAAVGVALVVAGAVGAFWTVLSDPGGNGHASVGSLPAAATPTTSLAGRDATVSWAQSVVVGTPLGQLTGGAYTITRYAASAPTTPIPAGGSCAGAVSGASDPISCTEPSLPSGRWLYTATPMLYSWVGVESAQGTGVAIAPDAPVSVALTNGAGTGNAYISGPNETSLTFDVVLASTSLASDTVTLSLTDGTTIVTATEAGIAGGGTRTFSGIDASGLTDGSITVSASAANSDGDPSSSTSITRVKDTVAPTLVTLVMQDTNFNGKVDRTLATFSEALAAYSAGTAPWTLSNVPSGGNHTATTVAGAVATLTIAEGAGAANTAVGAFTVALATNAAGIRDAAGNLSSFAGSAPADGARPVLVTGTLEMRDVDDDGRVDRVASTFSELLAASSDTAPWTLTAVPSGGTLASVSTAGANATLAIAEGAGALNTAVGTFRVALAASATGIRDAAGNQASLASTAPVDRATPVLASLLMQDITLNGKVDRTLATFSEALAAYSAGTAPWTLANVPSGGNHTATTVAGAVATLTIAEGAGAANTAVGAFTVALATNAAGIRDAAGNLSSFAGSAPADGARPVLVTGTLEMRDVDDDGRVDRVASTFSELLAASSDTAPWTLTAVPSGGTLASVSTAGANATLAIAEGAGALNTAVGTFRVALAASATGIRDAAGNQASLASTAPVDRATPVLASLLMQDITLNGKVDRTLATFSEALAAYSAGTAPWTLSNVPSGGNHTATTVAGAVATLTIAEGAGAANTAVGAFTVALATNAAGIRDAAGNLSSFAGSAPADGARPVLVTGTLEMRDVDDDGRVDRVASTFSELLAASSDTAPWTLTAVPSGGTLASVSTAGANATLAIAEGAGALNTAVGTFRVALAASATGIRDAAGNQASLASTAPVDRATPVLASLLMQDTTLNGKVDRTLATFSEALAAYSAGTAPWTLANVPSGGNHTATTVAGAVATLTIAEGAGAANTAVGAFTVALATNAAGIRDAAGNLSSFAGSAPADGARPVLVAGTLEMRDVDDDGRVDRVASTFSELLAASSDTAPWTLTAVPSGGTLASVSTAGANATLAIAEGAGALNTAVGTFRVALAASATGIRDAAGNQASLASTAPVDRATPVLASLLMQDVTLNGKVDRTLATFSEALAAYSAGTAPWTLANVPSGGNHTSTTVAGAVATLTIAEGAGAANTAVGAFTVALATNAAGIRDAAGNLSSFAGSAPADGARPVPVSVTSTSNGVTAGLMEAGDEFAVTFSEAIATVGPNTAITETDPSGPGNDTLTIAGLTAVAGVSTGSNLYIATDGTNASFSSSTMSSAGAVITATVSGLCSGACGVEITAGIGALVFMPDPGLQDAAGNVVTGSLTTAATFRLF